MCCCKNLEGLATFIDRPDEIGSNALVETLLLITMANLSTLR